MNRIVSTTLLAIAASLSLSLSAHAADADAAAAGSGLTPGVAKDLKNHSEADYKARQKVAEANETLNKADCSSALEGSAKRACAKAAKAAAKSDKADAKVLHEVEEKAIRDAKK